MSWRFSEISLNLFLLIRIMVLLLYFVPRGTRLPEIFIAEEIILDELSGPNVNKAQGPDGISSWIMKLCRESLSTSLTMIYQQSLNSGKLPSD